MDKPNAAPAPCLCGRQTCGECRGKAAPAPDADRPTAQQVTDGVRASFGGEVPLDAERSKWTRVLWISGWHAGRDTLRATIEQQARELADLRVRCDGLDRLNKQQFDRAERAERDLSAARAAIAALIAWWDDEITPMDMERERRVWTAARAAMGEK